jgi:hypothetical protein
MREHTHLPAMVGLVRKHVAQHFQANRPRPSPAVSAKLLDAAPTTAERLSEHLLAASGALGQFRTGLPLRAVRAVELSWNLQVRSCKPDPLGADIVPPHRTVRALLRIRLPAWMSEEEARNTRRMQNAWGICGLLFF